MNNSHNYPYSSLLFIIVTIANSRVGAYALLGLYFIIGNYLSLSFIFVIIEGHTLLLFSAINCFFCQILFSVINWFFCQFFHYCCEFRIHINRHYFQLVFDIIYYCLDLKSKRTVTYSSIIGLIRLIAVTRAVVQALGFKCIICDGEFASKHAADCHRRQPAFIGTKCALHCADPRSIRSLSLTERPNVSVGILRHHSTAPLGQSMYI